MQCLLSGPPNANFKYVSHVSYHRIFTRTGQYSFSSNKNISTILHNFFPWSTFAAAGMCCTLCKQKCFVLAQKAAKEVTFVLFFQRGAELLAFWGMMGAKKGCIGMKTYRWITSWHVVCFLISRWQPTVFWPMGDDDFLRWTSGAFFLHNFLSRINLPRPIPLPIPLCPPMGDQWKRGSHKIRRAFDISRFALDYKSVTVRHLYHSCQMLLTQFSTQRNTIAHLLRGL